MDDLRSLPPEDYDEEDLALEGEEPDSGSEPKKRRGKRWYIARILAGLLLASPLASTLPRLLWQACWRACSWQVCCWQACC